MKLLAFDTCCGFFSLVLVDGSTVIYSYESTVMHEQSARLVAEIEKGLAACNLSYKDLTNIAVTIGPGSFTGIRIGLAAAQGLALALSIPIIGVTTLEALAFGKPGKVVATLDAGRSQYYCQRFTDGIGDSPTLLSAEEILAASDYQVVGALGADKALPHAKSVAQAALAKIANNEVIPRPEPYYIREPDAVKKYSL